MFLNQTALIICSSLLLQQVGIPKRAWAHVRDNVCLRRDLSNHTCQGTVINKADGASVDWSMLVFFLHHIQYWISAAAGGNAQSNREKGCEDYSNQSIVFYSETTRGFSVLMQHYHDCLILSINVGELPCNQSRYQSIKLSWTKVYTIKMSNTVRKQTLPNCEEVY